MKVYVHLAYGYSQLTWGRLFDERRLVGINERDAYGYMRAEEMGAEVTSSDDHHEGRLNKLNRLSWRWFLGFDVIHALRNRKKIFNSDVIWTHTESQFLAVLMVYTLMRVDLVRRPKIIAQSVWLIDIWYKQPALRRWLWRQLIARADILTFHSPENLARAREMFPNVRSELVLFGIKPDSVTPNTVADATETVRLIAVGNDRQRSWSTLIEMMRKHADWELRIVSTTCPQKLKGDLSNVIIAGVRDNDELIRLYEAADIAVVPLKPNFHASGITAIQEATLCGLPVVASDTGGLRAYFGDKEVCYVATEDPAALARAVADLAADTAARAALVANAKLRMGPEGLSSEAFVRRHMVISRTLLGIE